jgi:hypothetical protein
MWIGVSGIVWWVGEGVQVFVFAQGEAFDISEFIQVVAHKLLSFGFSMP